MSSDDLNCLRNLLFQDRYSIQEIVIKYGDGDKATNTIFTLKKENKKIEFSSCEDDIFLYGSSFHRSLDHNGNWILSSYADDESYYQTIDQLFDKDEVKKKVAYERIVNGSYRPHYDSEKLLRKFILSHNRKNINKFKNLREDYFEILINQALILNKYLELDKKLQQERLGYAELSKKIEIILRNSFLKTDNPVKNFLDYHKTIDLNIEDILKKIQEEKDYHYKIYELIKKDLPNKDIKNLGKVPLDIYRRYCELSSHFINAIRISVERGNGNDNPIPYKKFLSNVEFLKSIPEYAILVKGIEPQIRHSESHINTEIDEKTAIIRITEKKGKNRKLLCEYPLNEISRMTLTFEKDFFPAMTISFTIFESFLLLQILNSFEYRTLLLGIGNLK
jgi:hypothetical protein